MKEYIPLLGPLARIGHHVSALALGLMGLDSSDPNPTDPDLGDAIRASPRPALHRDSLGPCNHTILS